MEKEIVANTIKYDGCAQFEAYFKEDLWKRNAEHSNKMAQLLYGKVKDIPFIKVMYPVQ